MEKSSQRKNSIDWCDAKFIKVFNDSVHGHIELQKPLVMILNTEIFQRLRDIKQLGMCDYVYPGASHNRFEHSIGVCHLAGELVKELRNHQPHLEISEKDVLCLQIAGLCHDLGHGPFSHLFTNFMRNRRSSGKKWRHEPMSVKMFDHLIRVNRLEDVLKKAGLDETDLVFIKELIDPLPYHAAKEWPHSGRGKDKAFLYQIVANNTCGIDVDKFDYFARDAFHLGFTVGLNHTRYFKFARVLENDGMRVLCTRDKVITDLYEIFHTRSLLYRRAYFHKAKEIIEYMFLEALYQVDDSNFRIKGENGKELKISEAVDDEFAFTRLTDHIFYDILHSTEDDLEGARLLLRKILQREIYKSVGDECIKEPFRNELLQKGKLAIAEEIVEKSQHGLEVEDLIIQIKTFDHGVKDARGYPINPMTRVMFYEKDGQLNQYAKRIGEDEVSDMLSKASSEHRIRVYCKDPDFLSEALYCFESWILECTGAPASKKRRTEHEPAGLVIDEVPVD